MLLCALAAGFTSKGRAVLYAVGSKLARLPEACNWVGQYCML